MRLRLTAFSEFGPLVVLDPASAPGGVPSADLYPTIDAMSIDGRCIFYCTKYDGVPYDFLILIDEPAEDRLLQHRKTSITDSLLSVPSGRLVVTCCEDLTDNIAAPTTGETAEIPPGDYRVDAFGLAWENEFEKECSRRAVPGDMSIEKLANAIATVIEVTAISAWLIGLVALVSLCVNSAWKIGLLLLFGLIAINAILRYLVNLLTNRSSAWRRMQELRRALKSEFPDVVIVLRRSADSELPTTITPGKFRAGC